MFLRCSVQVGLLLSVSLVTLACGGGTHHGVPSGPPVTTDATYEVSESPVVFTSGGREIPGTLVSPVGAGPWPAVLLLAGSGPTDRDWTNPMLPGTNGSARLLAEALARRGVVVLRFDKAGSGENPGPPLAEWTLDTYRDEAHAALSLLRERVDVRRDQVFVAGHSEGGIHATRLAQVAGGEIAAVLYLSAVSRSMADTMLTQIEGNLRSPMANLPEGVVEAELASLRHAFSALLAGEPVDPLEASTIPQIQALVASLLNPDTLALTRGLLGFDNAREAALLEVPLFVLNGGKDIQVDADLDGRHLVDALTQSGREVTSYVAPDADHVLKHQPLTMAELRADLVAVQVGYNGEGRSIDPLALAAIVEFLVTHTP